MAANDQKQQPQEKIREYKLVRRRPINKAVFKDVLGADGDIAMKGIAKNNKRNKIFQKRMFDMIKVACLYQDSRMNKKKRLLENAVADATADMYKRMDYNLVKHYDALVDKTK